MVSTWFLLVFIYRPYRVKMTKRLAMHVRTCRMKGVEGAYIHTAQLRYVARTCSTCTYDNKLLTRRVHPQNHLLLDAPHHNMTEPPLLSVVIPAENGALSVKVFLFQWGSKVSTNWSNTWKHACYCASCTHLQKNMYVSM